MSASGWKADVILTVLRTIYDHNGAPDPSAARGKSIQCENRIDHVCHNAAYSKGSVLKFFQKTKGVFLVEILGFRTIKVNYANPLKVEPSPLRYEKGKPS